MNNPETRVRITGTTGVMGASHRLSRAGKVAAFVRTCGIYLTFPLLGTVATHKAKGYICSK